MQDRKGLNTLDSVRRFLARARSPAVLEPGANPLALAGDSYDLQQAGQEVILHVWSGERSLVRRITAIRAEAPGRMDLDVRCFPKKNGVLQLIDQARPSGAAHVRRTVRSVYREAFRRSVERQFPGWRVAELSSEPDLEHSLSPSWPRACIRKGSSGWAAIGAGEDTDAEHALAFGLIWLDYLRRRDSRVNFEGLILMLPEGAEASTCHRIRWLDAVRARCQVFIHNPEGERPVDIYDCGNIRTELRDLRNTPALPEWLAACASLPGVESVRGGGGVSLRIRGLEFAHWDGERALAGIGRREPVDPARTGIVAGLARELAQMRRPDANPNGQLYTAAPERWLESNLRQNIDVLDPTLLPSPVYSQALTLTGCERGIIDLLAADRQGRLSVIEVKASEDIHLPMQALDYWIRVRWHLERGDFAAMGYFPGLQLARTPPRIMLVAPALAFHSTTETLLGYFSSGIRVERIGLAADWRSGPRVMFHAHGNAPLWCDHTRKEQP